MQGLYNADGQRQVTIVSGTSVTGLYNANGNYNGVIVTGSSPKGIYHPCGALWVTVGTGAENSIYAPDGSMYIVASSNGYALLAGARGYQLVYAPAVDQPIVTSGAGSPVFTGQTTHTPKRIGDNTTVVDVANDPKFRYPGMPPGTLAPATINSRAQSLVMPGGISQGRRWDAQIEFVTSSKFVGLDWIPAAAAPIILVVVNGKWTGPAFTVTAASGSVSNVLLEFPDNRPRTVKLILGAHQIRTIGTETAYPPVRAAAAGKTLLTIGDSLSAGSGTATFLDVWPQATATILGFDHCCNAAIGGTKWVPSGTGDVAISHFGGDRLPLALTVNPEAVVFAGSRNDGGSNQTELDAITAAVVAALDATAISKRFVMGTFTVLPQSGAVSTGAVSRGVPYIDMQQGLQAADLVGGDGVHPPYAGAVNLRNRIVPALRAAACVP